MQSREYRIVLSTASSANSTHTHRYEANLYLRYDVVRSRTVSIAARSKTSTFFGRSNVGIAGSSSAQGMDMCLRFSVLCCPV
jgi:hypothetical protein